MPAVVTVHVTNVSKKEIVIDTTFGFVQVKLTATAQTAKVAMTCE